MCKVHQKIKSQSGQALLLVLLVLAVVLTLVLSSVSKSVTDVQISKYEDDAIRAFDAAQAGIERALVGSVTSGATVILDSGAKFTPEILTASSTGNYYRFPIELLSGESAIFWLVEHQKNANGDYVIACPGVSCSKDKAPSQFRLCWGKNGTSPDSDETPAAYIEFYYDTTTPPDITNLKNLKVISAALDPNSSRRSSNNFNVPETSGGLPCKDSDIAFSSLFKSESGSLLKKISDDGGTILFVRVVLFYNTVVPHPVAITLSGGGNMPSQGSVITSTGNAGDVYRKLVLYQGYPEIPFEFGNVIYSKGNLNKQ